MRHERILIERGAASGLPVIVAVDSTTLGPAVGGCRITNYPSWQDALADALRLSTAMTQKCALADLPHGGGKAVVALPPGLSLEADHRRAVLEDVAAVVERLGGSYATGPDVGTSEQDMAVIGRLTDHVLCRPPEQGGSGDPAEATAIGAFAAIRAVCHHLFGDSSLGGRSMALLGLGHVGSRLARLISDDGARLWVADVDDARRELAEQLGATWVSPADLVELDVDILVPAALGGLLSAETIPRLRCAGVVGPANNQLAGGDAADLLHRRGILYVPDTVVSAGGVIHATGVELRHESTSQIYIRLAGIADTVRHLLREAATVQRPPSVVADEITRRRTDATTEPVEKP
jgi:glutamate dehydrogenase/leucine dehydrogenase